jgi:hypothetical protein
VASPSTVLTLGFGSFGSADLLPTLGFGIADPTVGNVYVLPDGTWQRLAAADGTWQRFTLPDGTWDDA